MFPQILLFFLLSGPDWICSYEIGDCGISNIKSQPNIGTGESLRYNEFPWIVALYRLNNSSKEYGYLCSGSIIESNIVLTAAHCVHDETKMDATGSRIFVAAGKYNSSWKHWDPKEQRFEVISKKIGPNYIGFRNRFEDDIALLALNDSIKFSSAVMPVCIDWGNFYEPRDNEVGTVTGWGLDDNHVFSDKLKSLEISVRNFEECRKNGNAYTAQDKYCALTKNNSSAMTINSGGGLVFGKTNPENETRYFIKGILVGRINSHLLVTKISNYIPWIQQYLEVYNS